MFRLFTFILAGLSPFTLHAATLLIKNAYIVDPLEKTVTLKSVFVRDGRIEDFAQPNEEKADEVYDAKELWLVPGFNDMHVHSWGNDAPLEKYEVIKTQGTSERMLYAGVTSFLDLGSSEDHIFKDRENQRAGKFIGATIYTAGSVFFPGTKSSNGAHGVSTEKEATEEVKRFIKQSKPDVIKVIFDYDRTRAMKKEVLAAIVKAAKEMNTPTVVHIGTWLNAKHAAEAGATAITHLCEDAVIPDDTIKAMKDAKVYSIPTMAVQLDTLNIFEHPDLLERRLFVELTTKELRNAYSKMKTDPKMNFEIEWQKEGRVNDKKSLKKIYEAGIPLLTGSDSANYGSFQGYSLHRELELFVENGVPVWEALKAATISGDRFFGRPGGFERGASANFVLLKRDPIKDIKATQEIVDVFYKGRKIDRNAILKSSFSRLDSKSASNDK